MDMEAMVVMDVATMERGRLKLRLDTPEDMEDMDMGVMVAMDVDTMARGKLMLNPVMVDMVIAVKFLPLFIISPPIIDILIGFKTKNMNKKKTNQKKKKKKKKKKS